MLFMDIIYVLYCYLIVTEMCYAVSTIVPCDHLANIIIDCPLVVQIYFRDRVLYRPWAFGW